MLPLTRTQAQIDAARANGAKSHGPATPEGRQTSSMNALKGGLFAQTLVLAGESQDQLDELHRSYVSKFQPADPVELDLVQEMVAAKWRQKRAWALETDVLDISLADQRERVGPEFDAFEDHVRTAAAYDELCNQSTTLDKIARAEAGYGRQFDRALKNLLQLRKLALVPLPIAATKNEPEPVPIAAPQPATPETALTARIHRVADIPDDESDGEAIGGFSMPKYLATK